MPKYVFSTWIESYFYLNLNKLFKSWKLCRSRILPLISLTYLVLVVCAEVRIKELFVPTAFLDGSDEVILDCDYTLHQEDVDSLEVKWYFRHEARPFYQWIPPNPPQIIDDRFSDRINLGYEATAEPLGQHRALQLRNLTWELSGLYECRVSSIYDEDFEQKELIVYAEMKGARIRAAWSSPNSLNIECSVNEAYPEPNVYLNLINRGIGWKKWDK